MSKFVSFALVVSVLLATPVSAQLITNLAVFPVVARGPGLHQTQWVTDLSVHNPMDHEVDVMMIFFPADQLNSPYPQYADFMGLYEGQTVLIDDVLQTTFGLGNAAMGLLYLYANPSENPEGTVIHANARIYNDGDVGTFGQTVPASFAEINVGWAASFITGARNDGTYRSNLGITNTKFAELRVHYQISASDGSILIEGFREIHSLSMSQWSFEELGVGLVSGPISVRLWLDPEDVDDDPCGQFPFHLPRGFLAYVSKVDNLTGDAEYLQAIPLVPFICDLQD